ncbi:hypothetical protein DJ94_5026 [Bacillus pseudomycoides]|nr:hypothetical protein DJ94_5026 [Bacillus pseudomycoides]
MYSDPLLMRQVQNQNCNESILFSLFGDLGKITPIRNYHILQILYNQLIFRILTKFSSLVKSDFYERFSIYKIVWFWIS